MQLSYKGGVLKEVGYLAVILFTATSIVVLFHSASGNLK
jgi:hypothetical protein